MNPIIDFLPARPYIEQSNRITNNEIRRNCNQRTTRKNLKLVTQRVHGHPKFSEHDSNGSLFSSVGTYLQGDTHSTPSIIRRAIFICGVGNKGIVYQVFLELMKPVFEAKLSLCSNKKARFLYDKMHLQFSSFLRMRTLLSLIHSLLYQQ